MNRKNDLKKPEENCDQTGEAQVQKNSLREILDDPNPYVLADIKANELYAMDSIDGMETLYVEMLCAPFIDEKTGDLILIFIREKSLIDYAAVDIDEEYFRLFRVGKPIGLQSKIRHHLQAIAERFKQNVNRLRALATKQFLVLRDLGFENAFIEELISLFPKKLHFKLKNPHLKRRPKGQTT